VEVIQSDSPSEEEILRIHGLVIESVSKLYYDKRPDWETRPLVIK